ncbi:MAG: ZIP family metal transporter [Epulopiscium sp.]|nr:ZIP family metal transporter [Candidatus Epulonipiscium sp.]
MKLLVRSDTVVEWLSGFNAPTQALFASIFTWGVTALGAGLVFFFKEINKKVLNSMLGFAAGVMTAASFWSLLEPSIEMAGELGKIPWLTAAIGFSIGGLVIYIVDKILPHLHSGLDTSQAEGIKTNWQRSVLLVLAITLHNIPEGLAVGVAFGTVAHGVSSATLASAVVLTIGIALQNFPEGAAVSIPLRREGLSRSKAFFYGQASAIVQPIAAVIGALTVAYIENIMPFALSFAAGAMIYVVVEELIPESHRGDEEGHSDIVTIGFLIGFVIMMMMDVALG